jgi:iron-sulfur cluster assembly accessory protein
MRANLIVDGSFPRPPARAFGGRRRIIEDVESSAPTQVFAVTQRAAEKAIELARREGHTAPHLRLRVTAGGCSGFSYRLSFEDDQAEGDSVVEAHGLKVLIDGKSLPIVAGSTLEFSDAMLGGGFKVNNPQTVHECACGESFSI